MTATICSGVGASPHDLLHLGDRMLAVEEGHEVEQHGGKHRDLIGEAGGVAQRDAALPFVVDRKGLERAESGAGAVGHSTSR
jgi:hypothetical protein